MSNRLSSCIRRDLIVEAAIPLFARKGFAGTTTREIAEAAGVSEGLVFKYFANKTALYDAIIHRFEGQHPTFDEIRDLAPSSHTLLQIVCVTTKHFFTIGNGSELLKAGCRMLLRSLCEDGAFARVGMEAYATELRTFFEQCFEAARRSGDLVDDAPDAHTAFWILSQQQFMLGAWGLAAERASPPMPLRESTHALLRSIGLREHAIHRLEEEDDKLETSVRKEAKLTERDSIAGITP